MTQLERIEAKLDQLLHILGATAQVKSDTPIAATPADRYGYVASQPWFQTLVLAHCKVKRDNWQTWEAMWQKYGAKLSGLAQMLDADQRWPDKVQAYIDRTEQRNTNLGKLKDTLAECGMVVNDKAVEEWRALIRGAAQCSTVDMALEFIRFVSDSSILSGKPAKWPADATPWIASWHATQTARNIRAKESTQSPTPETGKSPCATEYSARFKIPSAP